MILTIFLNSGHTQVFLKVPLCLPCLTIAPVAEIIQIFLFSLHGRCVSFLQNKNNLLKEEIQIHARYEYIYSTETRASGEASMISHVKIVKWISWSNGHHIALEYYFHHTICKGHFAACIHIHLFLWTFTALFVFVLMSCMRCIGPELYSWCSNN